MIEPLCNYLSTLSESTTLKLSQISNSLTNFAHSVNNYFNLSLINQNYQNWLLDMKKAFLT